MTKIFEKDYDDESLCDVGRDVMEAFDERFNPPVKDLPREIDEYGFGNGKWTVTISWSDDDG